MSDLSYLDILDLLSLLKPIKTNHELIRIGGDRDGGYLIPNDLVGIDSCFSPGVSSVADFENDLTKKGIKCFLADFSVDAPPIKNELFDFEKKYIGISNNEFYITLENWIELKASNKIDFILQMDIEGSEYAVILNTAEFFFSKFRIILIEFHGLDQIFTKKGYEFIRPVFSKLLKNFDIVHIHPNNCCGTARHKDIVIPRVMEFTFLRKDRITHRSPAKIFPHPLDRKNVVSYPDIHLPSCWY